MSFAIEYGDSFDPKHLKGIPASIQDTIDHAIQIKLTQDPVTFGKPLQYALKGCRRLRVGDYRVVYFIRKKTVIILDIRHRSKIY